MGLWFLHRGPRGPLPLRWMWSGKHYTTSTVLPSGEGLKKMNFVCVLLNFAPVLTASFAPGGYLTPTLRVSPSPSTERGLRASEGGEVCQLPLPLPLLPGRWGMILAFIESGL